MESSCVDLLDSDLLVGGRLVIVWEVSLKTRDTSFLMGDLY